MAILNNDILHSGVAHDENPPGRGSGRYGWGSGENPYQHQFTFLSEVEKLRNDGYSDDEIAKILIDPHSNEKELRQNIINNTRISTSQVAELRKKGYTEKQIAEELLGEKATPADLKAKIATAEKRERQEMINKVTELYSKTQTAENPKGNKSKVARELGINESSVRGYLDEAKKESTNKYWKTAEVLREAINKSPVGIIDVSNATEISMNVTKNTKKIAISILQEEGYVKSWIKFRQPTTGESTSMMVLAAPPDPEKGETYHDVMKKIQQNKLDVSPIVEYSPDEGRHFYVPEYPSSMDSSRVYIRYPKDGGKEKDGVIEIRRGVEDLSLGNSQYAQVRIAVDGTHYMKGMAIYSDDIPKGYDIVYNTSKPDSWPMMGPNKNEEVLKRLKNDPDNPFGATIKAGGQSYYEDPKGQYVYNGSEFGYHKANKGDEGSKRYSLSPINKINEEGDWDTWSRNLSSQFLSKQPIKLINQQIDATIKSRQREYNDIINLTNPVIKKKLLEDFADNCDKTASDLAVKGFKGQAFQIILPLTNIKTTEIYAPNYKNGDTVALVRYPHQGIFEIPILKVNNNFEDGKKILGKTKDAVGIHPSVAEILSGADFDGDTAMVIPLASNKIAVSSKPKLKQLENWDYLDIYRLPDSAPDVKDKTKQTEMGKVTNLITDMTAQGAPIDDVAKAVKHAMVVIDCVKHRLDWKQSERDNDILALSREYQGEGKNGARKGASTIFSQARSKTRVNERKEVTRTSDMTPEELKAFQAGKKIYHDTGKIIEKTRIRDPKKMTEEELALYNAGKKVYRDIKPKNAQSTVKRMYLVDDAMDLVRDKNNPKEVAYAKYANTLKDMANKARQEYRSIKPYKINPHAKEIYAKEVGELEQALLNSESNAPKERYAGRLANKIVAEKIKSNPELEFDHEHLSRENNRAMVAARAAVGAKRDKIYITDKQWEAIQSNAISSSKVEKIFRYSDQDRFRDLATPKDNVKLTNAQINRLKAMMNSGNYTNAEIAQIFGVSPSTLYKYTKED